MQQGRHIAEDSLIRFIPQPAAGGMLNFTQNRNHQLHRVASHQNECSISTDSNLGQLPLQYRSTRPMKASSLKRF